MTEKELIEWLKDQLMEAKNSATQSRSAGTKSAGFNYDLGQIDAFQQTLDRLEDNDD
jgi:hypothetical protein